MADAAAARPLAAAPLPAAGVRVLDLTRVIAGPVATRTLALLGADVLRVDSPRLPEAEDAHADTGFGKRSTRLDLADPADRAAFEVLLATADAVVTGYRPGALDAYGLAPDALLERRPGLIVAQLNAWGWTGPWAGRRGFDSLVQAGVGIAAVEAGDGAGALGRAGRPGVLPAQALDHGTGYLIAAGVLRALTDQRTGRPGGRHLRYSLAGTASWLQHGIMPAPPLNDLPYEPERWLAETDSPYGRLRHALPRSPTPAHPPTGPARPGAGDGRAGLALTNPVRRRRVGPARTRRCGADEAVLCGAVLMPSQVPGCRRHLAASLTCLHTPPTSPGSRTATPTSPRPTA